VIPRTDQDGRVLRHGRRTFASHPGKTHAEFFQPPQAAWRLGETEMPLPGIPHGSIVDGRYLRCELRYTIFEGHV
jgi:hypothetical protein